MANQAGEGGGEGSPCRCLCTVYGSNRVHLFKKPKTYLSLSSRFLQKLENTKKEKEKGRRAVHSEASVSRVPESARLLALSGKLHPGGSFWTSDLKVKDRSFLLIWLGGGGGQGPRYHQK